MKVTIIADQVCAIPVARVFATAVDPERFPSLFRGFGPIAAVTRIDLSVPLAVGVTRAVHIADGSVLEESVTALDVPHRHAYTLRGFGPPLSWLVRIGEAEWHFTDARDTTGASATRVSWQYRFTLTTGLVWPIVYPLLTLFMGTAMRRCLRELARISPEA